MEYDLIISGGTVVVPGAGLHEADLAIVDGRVGALLPRAHGAVAREQIDATGHHLFPGVVDAHVHVDMGPGEERWQETRSAALGGITTLFSYLMSPNAYSEIFPIEKAKGEAEAMVDFGLHFSLISAQHLLELDQYVREFGVTSFKHLMHLKGDAGAYLGFKGPDDGYLWQAMLRLSRYPQTVLVVHTENQEILDAITADVRASGRNDLAAYCDSRPDFVEASALQFALFLARVSGARVHIPHLTSALALGVFEDERRRNADIYLETCPQYLTHTMFSPIGTLGKVSPPLRTSRDCAALWDGVTRGSVDTIGSDHVPRRMEKKGGGIWQASAGFPGLATLLPVILSEGHHRRGLPLDHIAQLVSRRPAEIFGVYPRKGTLAIGSDADVAIVDLALERTVSATELGSYCDYSIYDGWRLRGWPVRTIVRGRTVMVDGHTTEAEGHGRYLAR